MAIPVTYHSKSLFVTPCCQSQLSTLHGSLVPARSTEVVEKHHRSLGFTSYFYLHRNKPQICTPLFQGM